MTEAKKKFVFMGRTYYVTSRGHVENQEHHRISLNDNGHGYVQVSLYSKGIRKNFYVHRLVAILFIPNPLLLPEVNHKDGNKSNNSVANLEWVSKKDNEKHAAENSLVKSGHEQWKSKLTWPQLKVIYKGYWAGIPAKDLMAAFAVDRHTINDIARCRRYKNELKELHLGRLNNGTA